MGDIQQQHMPTHHFTLFGEAMNRTDLNSAQQHLRRAKHSLVGSNNNEQWAYYYLNKATLMNNLGWFSESISYTDKAEQLLPRSVNREVLAKMAQTRTVAYMNIGDFDSSIEHNHKAINLYRKSNNMQAVAHCKTLEGTVLLREGDWAEAIALSTEALGIATQYGYEITKAKVYMQLGFIFRTYRFLYLAIQHFYDAERIYRKERYEIGTWEAMYERANTTLSLEPFSPEGIEQAIRIIQQMDQLPAAKTPAAHKVWSLWYVIHNQKHEFNKALEYAEKLLDFARKLNDKRGMSEAYHKTGSSYYNLRDMEQAMDYGNKGLAIAIEIGDKLLQIQCQDLINSTQTSNNDENTRRN